MLHAAVENCRLESHLRLTMRVFDRCSGMLNIGGAHGNPTAFELRQILCQRIGPRNAFLLVAPAPDRFRPRRRGLASSRETCPEGTPGDGWSSRGRRDRAHPGQSVALANLRGRPRSERLRINLSSGEGPERIHRWDPRPGPRPLGDSPRRGGSTQLQKERSPLGLDRRVHAVQNQRVEVEVHSRVGAVARNVGHRSALRVSSSPTPCSPAKPAEDDSPGRLQARLCAARRRRPRRRKRRRAG